MVSALSGSAAGSSQAAIEEIRSALAVDAQLFEESGDTVTAAKIRTLAGAFVRAAALERTSASIYLSDGADPSAIRTAIEAVPGVVSVDFESKDQAYQRFVQIFKNQPALTTNISPQELPASFRVKLAGPGPLAALQEGMKGVAGVERVLPGGDQVIESSLQSKFQALEALCPPR